MSDRKALEALVTLNTCPTCGKRRDDLSRPCLACAAPGLPEHRHVPPDETVREEDLEPYVALRYIARLFKVLAVLIVVMLIGEITLGVIIDGRSAVTTLLGEATRLLVMAGMLWAAGDIALLLVDAGHDVRVSRILLGRINARIETLPALPPPPVREEEPVGAGR
jgi:hypothetical protein